MGISKKSTSDKLKEAAVNELANMMDNPPSITNPSGKIKRLREGAISINQARQALVIANSKPNSVTKETLFDFVETLANQPSLENISFITPFINNSHESDELIKKVFMHGLNHYEDGSMTEASFFNRLYQAGNNPDSIMRVAYESVQLRAYQIADLITKGDQVMKLSLKHKHFEIRSPEDLNFIGKLYSSLYRKNEDVAAKIGNLPVADSYSDAAINKQAESLLITENGQNLLENVVKQVRSKTIINSALTKSGEYNAEQLFFTACDIVQSEQYEATPPINNLINIGEYEKAALVAQVSSCNTEEIVLDILNKTELSNFKLIKENFDIEFEDIGNELYNETLSKENPISYLNRLRNDLDLNPSAYGRELYNKVRDGSPATMTIAGWFDTLPDEEKTLLKI